MSASWRVGSAKMGRMSSNKTPLVGKSWNWRRACLSLILRRDCSAVVEAEAAGCPALPWVWVASGPVGCDAV